jgi:hypothetical protein
MKLGIFCLPGFVEDRGQSCFSRHASSFMCVTQERDRERERDRQPEVALFLLAKFRQKEKFKIRQRSEFEGFQSPEVREKEQKRGKIARLVIWFHCVAKNIEG